MKQQRAVSRIRVGSAAGRAVSMGMMALTGLAVSLAALTVSGCAGQEEIMPGPDLAGQGPDVARTTLRLIANDRRWTTLDAQCDLMIRSDYLQGQQPQVTLRGGRLRIQKPGKINLTLPASGPVQIRLIGDGALYRVELPFFAHQYSGRYGEPLPTDRPRILLMPQDVAGALDWTGLFVVDNVPVTRQDPGINRFCIDSLRPVYEPVQAVYLDNTIVLDAQGEQAQALRRYDRDGSMRVEIRYAGYKVFANVDKEPVNLPTLIWIGYGPGRTSTLISLTQVELDVKLVPALFDAGG